MVKERKHITFFRFFFLAIFLLYFGGVTLFSHTHVVNGVIIVHSHHYSGEHEHSEKGLETIFFLSIINSFGETGSPISLAAWLSLIGFLPIPACCNKAKAVASNAISLRAPPVLF